MGATGPASVNLIQTFNFAGTGGTITLSDGATQAIPNLSFTYNSFDGVSIGVVIFAYVYVSKTVGTSGSRAIIYRDGTAIKTASIALESTSNPGSTQIFVMTKDVPTSGPHTYSIYGGDVHTGLPADETEVLPTSCQMTGFVSST
jgi:hypothetical protein